MGQRLPVLAEATVDQHGGVLAAKAVLPQHGAEEVLVSGDLGDHHLGVAEQLGRPDGEETRVAGAAPDEGDPAARGGAFACRWRWRHGRGTYVASCVQLLSRWFFRERCFHDRCFHEVGGAVGEHLLGEAGPDAVGVAGGT